MNTKSKLELKSKPVSITVSKNISKGIMKVLDRVVAVLCLIHPENMAF